MTDASTTAPEPDTLVSLWDEAWVWLFNLFSVFPEPEAIAGEGLTRRVALLLKNWLWSIEGMLRRLIIATALKISCTLPAPKPQKPRTKANSVKRKPGQPCFHIFSRLPPFTGEVRRSREGGESQGDSQAKPAYRHASFTRDPLLVIGEAPPRRKGGPRPARIRPRLDRYHLGREAEESFRSFFGPFRDRSECLRLGAEPPPPRERAEARIGHHILPVFDREAWLAAEAEEAALHPAPGIASHIAALKRLADDPNPCIRPPGAAPAQPARFGRRSWRVPLTYAEESQVRQDGAASGARTGRPHLRLRRRISPSARHELNPPETGNPQRRHRGEREPMSEEIPMHRLRLISRCSRLNLRATSLTPRACLTALQSVSARDCPGWDSKSVSGRAGAIRAAK